MTMPTVVSNSGGPSAGSLVVASAGPSGRGSGSSPSGSSTSSSRPSGPSGPGGDELGPSSDEVKVFQNEGEDDRDKSDSGNLQADLLEEESSLITESEQEKSRRDGFAGFGFGSMSPYLFGSYAAAAYANGSHLARSPYLYGDPLSSPPPAHMGTYLDKAGVAGLRPPLYGLPPHAAAAAAAGYPYHMLGADQLAAWHHQAAYGLRPGSPYSLPITSTSLSSMSRFSPTGFLSHPGLAAAVAAGSPVGAGVHGQHLPQHMKQEYGHSRGSHHSDKDLHSPSKASKRDSHIKKPLNAFMLYMKEMRPVVQAECTLKESAAINQILGRRWHSLSRDEQAKYYEKARAERQKHMQMYPHWNARDNYRFGLKKKKRKRDKADDPASSMKKCRARFGLDQQDLWCKPCSPGNNSMNGNNSNTNHNLNVDEQLGASANGSIESVFGSPQRPNTNNNGYIRPASNQSLDQNYLSMGLMPINDPNHHQQHSEFVQSQTTYGDEYLPVHTNRSSSSSELIDFSKLVPVPLTGSNNNNNTLVANHLFEDPPSVSSQYIPPTPYYDQMPPNSYEDPSFGSPISTPMSQHDLIADMYDMGVPNTAQHPVAMSMGQNPNSLVSTKEDYDNSSTPYANEPKYISL